MRERSRFVNKQPRQAERQAAHRHRNHDTIAR